MNGILSYQQLEQYVSKKYITANNTIENKQYQSNTLDLRLGKVAYRVRSSFISAKKMVKDKVEDLLMYELDLTKGAILEKGCVYVIPLQECLNLPENIYGKTNPKSSTGRLDIFTRVLTDYNYKYNIIRTGYSGELFIEVTPMSFAVLLRENDCLNQLRLISGNDVRCTHDELVNLNSEYPLLYNCNNDQLPIGDVIIDDGLFMRIDLSHSKQKRIVGYKSKKNSAVIDFRQKNAYKYNDFWEEIYSNKSQEIIIEPEVFYIFATKERIVIPPGVCGEMIPYDPDSGEMRVHYAGFFDTGFGFGDHSGNGLKGAKAVLEIRPHDVPFLIEDGQILFRLIFDKNIQIPRKLYGDALNSNYQCQGLSLSKHFI